MLKFDAYFQNIEVISYFSLEKFYKLRCWLSWLWYHKRHG